MVAGGKPQIPYRAPQHAAFRLLLRAHDYAVDVQRDVWDFALELAEFLRAGVSRSDLRWMICKGYVAQGREKRLQSQEQREFQLVTGLNFSRRTCLILTPTGVQAARGWCANGRTQDGHSAPPAISLWNDANVDALGDPIHCPHWDRDRHTLRVQGQLVKEFKVPSPNQETILTAFEEDGWPPRIDDPLPMVHGIEPKRRLQDTVKSLNRNQRVRLVRFMGDGTGEGVRWEFVTVRAPVEVPQQEE